MRLGAVQEAARWPEGRRLEVDGEFGVEHVTGVVAFGEGGTHDGFVGGDGALEEGAVVVADGDGAAEVDELVVQDARA